MKKEVIIIAILVIASFFIGYSIKSDNSNTITNLQSKINDLAAEKNSLQEENNKSLTEIKQLGLEKEYLGRINEQMKVCEKEVDCVRAQNGCCWSNAVNKKYRELWLNTQDVCDVGCVGIFDFGFALCENNLCEMVYLIESQCEESIDCLAYDVGCSNKGYVERVSIAEGAYKEELGFTETDEWTCKCLNSKCKINESSFNP